MQTTNKGFSALTLALFYILGFGVFGKVAVGNDSPEDPNAVDLVGPMVGLVRSTEAHVLIRAGEEEQPFQLRLFDAFGRERMVTTTQSKSSQDFVAKFHLTGLKPATEYRYAISSKGNESLVQADKNHSFKTLPDSRKNRFTVSFVSCANATAEPVWREINSLEVDLLCLNGDTPLYRHDQSGLGIRKASSVFAIARACTVNCENIDTGQLG